jgi:hypothetical protein
VSGYVFFGLISKEKINPSLICHFRLANAKFDLSDLNIHLLRYHQCMELVDISLYELAILRGISSLLMFR